MQGCCASLFPDDGTSPRLSGSRRRRLIGWRPEYGGPEALQKAAADSPDLVVVDEFVGGLSGLERVRRLMGVDAFVQTAAVSRQPMDAFREASEGLGIMAQLPPRPGKFEAELLLRALKQLTGAT